MVDRIEDPPLLAKADAFAARGHAGQIRNYSGRPYIEHPRAVSAMLRDAGGGDHVLAAALLHDLIEDTAATSEEIHRVFGADVGDLVDTLSDDPSIEPYERRKDALRERVVAGGAEAASVYAADKLTNVSDLLALYLVEGEAAARRFKAPFDLRLELWRRDVEALSSLDPLPPFVEELARELDTLIQARAEALHNS